jgi:hypothetical protein
MKKKILKQLLLITALLLVIHPAFSVQAKEQEFSDINVEVNVPEDTIILTKDTPLADEKWKQAGITDSKSEKDQFSDMGVQAIFYDPNTKTTVRLLQKQSSDSSKIFNLSLLTEDKQNEFFNSLVSSLDENTKATIEKYAHPEAIFFHYNVEMNKDGVNMKEVIYGTIVNGSSLTYDIFTKNNTAPLDESFVKALVDGTHFTKFIDKADVEKQQRDSLIHLAIGVVILILIIVIFVIISKRGNKKQQEIKKRKTDALTKFYMEQKIKEDKNIKDTPLYVNRTVYSEEVLKDFNYYNEFIKKFKFWISVAVMIIAILFLLSYSSATIIGFIVVIFLVFVFVYFQGIRIEKLVSRTLKSYDKNKMEAIFTFYEDYCTLSGIQYITKYPYSQITEVKTYKKYIYIYLGNDNALYLKKDGFEHEVDEFLKFMNKQTI